MKKLITLMLALSTGAMAYAQDEPEDRNDRVESLKIAFITEKLNLSSKEASAFWPVFNEFTDEMKKLREKERENGRQFNSRATVTDQEADRFISEQLANKQAQLDLTRKYSGEFKKVLPPRKVARLLTLEQEFKQQLLQRFKQRQERRQR